MVRRPLGEEVKHHKAVVCKPSGMSTCSSHRLFFCMNAVSIRGEGDPGSRRLLSLNSAFTRIRLSSKRGQQIITAPPYPAWTADVCWQDKATGGSLCASPVRAGHRENPLRPRFSVKHEASTRPGSQFRVVIKRRCLSRSPPMLERQESLGLVWCTVEVSASKPPKEDARCVTAVSTHLTEMRAV